jgi:hypothetical protein
VFGVLSEILFGQVIVVGLTLWLCRKVILLDHTSFLPVARLLNTAITTTGVRIINSATEIAEHMEKEVDENEIGSEESMEGRGI